MTGGGPLPVREYASAEEMRAHAKAVRDKAFAPVPTPPLRRPPPKIVEAKPYVAPSTLAQVIDIPAPDREVTRAAYLTAMRGLRANQHKMRTIVRLVAAVTGVSVDAMRSEVRHGPVTKARQIAYYLGRLAGYTYQAVSRSLGRADHTSSRHGVVRVKRVIAAQAIKSTTDPVTMAQRLWDADWPYSAAVARS